MKAIRPARPLTPVIHAGLTLAGIAAVLSACSGQPTAPPEPAPRPTPTARPAPPPPPPPPGAIDWRDAPITPGDWRWGMEGSRSVARFGGDKLVLSCIRDAGAITLIRPRSGDIPEVGGAVPITIMTSAGRHTVSGQALAGPPPSVALTLRASDGLLDAMAFSRGRFAVEIAGLPTLYVPSWPEVSRVIEDCR